MGHNTEGKQIQLCNEIDFYENIYEKLSVSKLSIINVADIDVGS